MVKSLIWDLKWALHTISIGGSLIKGIKSYLGLELLISFCGHWLLSASVSTSELRVLRPRRV